jgi:hypothetical protein
MKFTKEQAELINALADGETVPVKLQGFKPNISPEMQEHINKFKSWYDQEYGDGECPGEFVANFEAPELMTTGNELQKMLDEADKAGLIGV